MPSSAQTLINSAVAQGYDAISDRDLRVCLLYAAQTGGGGGTGSTLSGAGSPVGVITPSGAATYFDTTTAHFWAWNTATNAWTELIN
jgi:hypothetical protein